FLVDRAAMGGEDGATHHGVYGANFMRQMPHMQVFNPRSIQEMAWMIRWALSQDGPCAIRYPKAEHSLMRSYPCKGFSPGKWEELEKGQDIALVATGTMVAEAFMARQLLRERGHRAAVINASSIKPLDFSLIKRLSDSGIAYAVIEEQALMGGLGSAIGEYCIQEGLRAPEHIFAIPDRFITQGQHSELIGELGLRGEDIACEIAGRMAKTA
ncbi:MAG: 1-deoxy-D-xylulose-5-phosphate synthase, partial [Clostridiales bacterium]|nr:1-deoxy-D-xylulose-5-phosphate synthase [Clostridiales bacterium]